MNISLRGRITLWYAIAMTVLIFVVAFAAQQVMVLALSQSMEDSLERGAETVITAITAASLQTHPEEYDTALETLTDQALPSVPLLLRVANPRGQVIAEFGEIPQSLLPSLDSLFRKPVTGEGRFDTINIREVEALRIFTIPVYHPTTEATIAIVQTGESLSPITAARNLLWWLSLAVGAAGSVVTLAVGLLLFHRGFRPLDRILRHVQDVESSNLTSSLPDEPRPPELQRLADSLNSMWERLHADFNAKQMFVASVSHEIRTPLTALEGQIDVLLMQRSLDAEVQESLEKMSKEACRLVRMTNNLLLNAQLETTPAITTEVIGLAELIEEVIGEVWVLAQDIDLGFSTPGDVTVFGDRDLLKQLLLNIVDNAIKYTSSGGRVDMSITQEEGWAVLEVSDTGRGIPKVHLPYVMEAFYKWDNHRGSAGRGAGLGLAIVKQIVELHGGEIEIGSQEGSGTSVKIRLPLCRLPDASEPALAHWHLRTPLEQV
jgi:two-component system OmpR family sensor kinase